MGSIDTKSSLQDFGSVDGTLFWCGCGRFSVVQTCVICAICLPLSLSLSNDYFERSNETFRQKIYRSLWTFVKRFVKDHSKKSCTHTQYDKLMRVLCFAKTEFILVLLTTVVLLGRWQEEDMYYGLVSIFISY